MDAEFQRILVECNDPKKLAQYIQQPDFRRKIQKMQQAGLVQMQL
jgi:hypothetical protein